MQLKEGRDNSNFYISAVTNVIKRSVQYLYYKAYTGREFNQNPNTNREKCDKQLQEG